ncbi:hypothetical protein CH333_04870 [candidate division WOR-3 bacterium JGI_Cruoil_03_44_89]|mgnify:CR=1 FL=1|uniref:DUF5916 domain-containing protein n=1 Tax=candidate division WOR-3 bacterium JGI_Cruoil_03_44_89 TaxID=1973748 RepID=A0A235BTF9_UNCW3|nr:MAG: hypothetical protein CH333_04870 [candidate division WOR-3 bacterium JGI_Cruoil_03_44_89]
MGGVTVSLLIFLASSIGVLDSLSENDVNWAPNSGSQLVITAPRLSESPRIDGLLDDAVWQEAIRVSNFAEVNPGENVKPEVKTEVLIGYDDRNLYVGFICYESDVEKIRATLTKRDAFLMSDDCIGVSIYTSEDKGYLFLVNPYGIQGDGYDHGEGFISIDASFDTDWDAAAKILSDRWEAEISIPFKSLTFPRAREQHWRVRFLRVRLRESMFCYSWSPLSRDIPSSLSQAGHLWIKEEIFVKRTQEFLPYLIGFQNGSLAEQGNPESFETQSPDGRIGVTGKYRISPALTLDWAVKPDFAQIETDAPQIDVNTTFALYYYEKRPLFMEGSDIFGSPVRAIYTRSVNDPVAALKVTGKLGKTSIGYIGAYDEYTPWVVPFKEYSFSVASEKRSLSNIIRVRRSILKESYVGLLATSRDIDGSFSRVAGVDGYIRFLQNYSIEFQILGSLYREPSDTSIFPGYEWLEFGDYTSAFDGEEFDGLVYTLGFARRARYWGVSVWHEALSPTFRADNGFINRNDCKDAGITSYLSFYINRGIFERLESDIDIARKGDYAGNLMNEYLYPRLSIDFIQQTYLTLWYMLFPSTIWGETEFNDIWKAGGTLSTNFSKFFSGYIWYQFGKGINYYASPLDLGDFSETSLSLTLNPTPKFNTSFWSHRYWLWDDAGEEVYDVTVFENRIAYQFTKYLSLRLITQYNSSDKSLGVYPLMSFELTPFTVFYLGSNHNLYDFEEPYGISETSRQIFLKFQYMFVTGG